MTVIFLKSSITVIFYHLTFCYSYKFVNFKGREMLRYCVIVVDHVTCSRCIVFLIWSLKVSVILTKSGSYLSKQSQMGKCPILLACSNIEEVCIYVSVLLFYLLSHSSPCFSSTHFAAIARKLINKTVFLLFQGCLKGRTK